MHPLLDKEKQQQAKQYEKEKRILGLIGSIISIGFILLYHFTGFSQGMAFYSNDVSIILVVIFYLLVFLFLSTLLGLPLGYYSGYIHEKKWEFSNHTPKTWFADEIKSFVIGLFLFPLLLGLLLWIMAFSPDYWWLIAGSTMALIGIIFATLFPVLILPLFNKYYPIDNEELTSRLEIILNKVGLKPSGFFVEDMSKQTKKENAFLAGLGSTRRVVLGDNLLAQMTVPEIESVIAHEVGHYKYKHIWKNIGIGAIQQIVMFYILHQIMIVVFPHFLESTRWNLALFPIFSLIFSVLSGIAFSPLNMALSRYFERQADRTSLELTNNKIDFQKAMAGLANRNLSNAYPSKWIKMFFYSHPPIGERLKFAETFED
ncbi:MAG: M48 family metallopeptidase [Candidatus Marinimicrobia bacterium]|nr:M48 family metallopeptidase [Candidatus Neomarinimicrobiota bacterium]